jgi:hypothetical protein
MYSAAGSSAALRAASSSAIAGDIKKPNNLNG